MTFRSDALALTQDILSGGLGDTVTLYPVRAAAVGAHLGAGNEGTEVLGVFEVSPVLNDDLGAAVGVQNEAVTLTLDTDTATAHDVADRNVSIGFEDRLYDIVLVRSVDPGAVECVLREYL